MTVEYFTPSKEDVEQAPHLLKLFQLYHIYNDDGHLVGFDFEHFMTQEQKDAFRSSLLLNITSSGRIEFTSHQPYDTARAKAMAKRFLENAPLQPLDDASITEVGLTYGKSADPKDFNPVSVLLKLSDSKVGYRYRETKIIDGKTCTFYGQELPKDKK
jgi:hypothetical protein